MNRSNLRRSLVAVLLGLACTASATAQDAAAADPLALGGKAASAIGVETDAASLRTLSDTLRAPGEVKANAYATVLVAPRIEAQVLERFARLGDTVEAGQPLVRLSSVEVAETQGALIVAEQEWRRVAALGKQAVSARRYNEVRVRRDQARATLRAYGLTEGQIRTLLRKGSSRADGSFDLLAPAAGRIVTDDFLLGQRVEPGTVLFTLTREDTVWVEAQLPPGDAEKAGPDSAVQVLAHGRALPGRVVRRSHVTDARTRTTPVRIEVANREDLLHPGELVEVRIAAGGDREVLAVPAESVVLLQNQPTVFVAAGKGRFEPAPVQVGETRDGWTQVEQGLKVGQAYVRKGAFALKARLLRSQLGED